MKCESLSSIAPLKTSARNAVPPDLDFSQPDLSDGQIAEATSKAAMQMVLERENRRVGDFVTDARATVAVAYHRAAGVYEADADMQELGTAAAHY